jgi:uncharacterized protein (DUF362 family)
MMEHGLGRKHRGIIGRLKENLFVVGLLSILWFIFRTGRKPSRVAYPCQQVAAFNGNIWIATYILPIVSALPSRPSFLSDRRKLTALVAAVVVISAGVGFVWWRFYGDRVTPLGETTTEYGLTLTARAANYTPASDIFVVSGAKGNDDGLDELLDLMGGQGLKFYESGRNGENKGPDGLISGDDVILIKVNCQWDERGGTNTDLLKALIQAVVDHPDGFTGEIIVADNGQGENRGSLSLGGSFTYARNNAEDRSQSVQNVVDSFVGSHRVSTYLWSDITEIQVDEYSDGDYGDGFVVNETRNPRTGIMVSYAKFTTEHGTHVSFKRGIWDTDKETYDSDRLKVINVPILKSHTIYGVTASVKHYMGVPSDVVTSRISGSALDTHYTIGEGGMGTLMVETRYPVLNILDAIWVNVVPLSGPWTPDRRSTRLNVITASTDPVALDYWSSKYILHQAWQIRSDTDSPSMDPDNTESGFYGEWLRLSMAEIQRAGYQATVDEDYMNVWLVEMPVEASDS